MKHNQWWRQTEYLKQNPTLVLWLIREGKAKCEEDICDYFRVREMPPSARNLTRHAICTTLSQLKELHLIEQTNGLLAVTPLVEKLQVALGISITELSQKPLGAIWSSPLFGRPRFEASGVDVFVLMPFLVELQAVYEDHITRVVKGLNLSVGRADDFYTTHTIIEDIWQAIISSKLIVADCTGRNPNVFYEIGIAHTIGKPVVLIAQDLEDIPFDLRHRRCIRYEYTPRGMKDFESELKETIKYTVASNDLGANDDL